MPKPALDSKPVSEDKDPAPARASFEKAWRARFLEFARLRDDDAGIAGWSTTGLETRFRFFANLWKGGRRGASYLDVGCGAGTYSRWLADQEIDVIGVDYSLIALVKAKERLDTRVELCAADAGQLPFRSQSVDGALCFGVLQAVYDSERVVRELARVVRPGGDVWIDALNGTSPAASWKLFRRRLKGKPMHLRYESSRALLELMREAGFEQLTRHWLIILPGKAYRLHALVESAPMNWLLRFVPGFGALASHSFLIRGVKARTGTPAQDGA